MRKYEGMFLFDPAVVADWEAVQAELNRLLGRAGARIIVCNKWDDRRLAYEIRGRKRGTYALTFFEADETKLADLERDARLSESLLRCLILQADHLSDEEARAIAARPADHSLAEAERIGGRSGGGGVGRTDRDRDRDRDRDHDRRRRDEPRRPEAAAQPAPAKPEPLGDELETPKE